jgi:hypothetical protein
VNLASDRHRKIARLLLLFGLTFYDGMAAARQVPEERLDREAREILVKIAEGDLPGAMERADGLRRPSDQGLAAKLDQWKRDPNMRPLLEGASRRIALVDESHLGGCSHRVYSVGSTPSLQRWLFTWRDSSDGWRLGDLARIE